MARKQREASDGQPLWMVKIDLGDDATGIHEESWGSEAQLRVKYAQRIPGLYFEAQTDESDAEILVFASEDDAANGRDPIGKAVAVLA